MSETTSSGEQEQTPKINKCRNLTYEERMAVYISLDMVYENGKFPHGHQKLIAEKFGVHPITIARIWKRGRDNLNNSGDGKVDVRSLRYKSGSALKYDHAELEKKIKRIPTKLRTTMRDTADKLNVSTTTFHRLVRKHKIIRPSTSTLKPTLSELHKENRLAFVRSMVQTDGFFFKDQRNTIHIDEKWFYEQRQTHKAYVAGDEETQFTNTRHKSHMEKIMFLAAIARPRKSSPRSIEFARGSSGAGGGTGT